MDDRDGIEALKLKSKTLVQGKDNKLNFDKSRSGSHLLEEV